ncbi:MAG: hypothetical protein ACFE0J_23915 [Elainellaceae cyanobacterium]
MIPRFCDNDTRQSVDDLIVIQTAPFHWKSVILIQRVMLLCVMMMVGALVSSNRPAIAREPILDFGLTSSIERPQSAVSDQPSVSQQVAGIGQQSDVSGQQSAGHQLIGAALSSLPPLAIPSNEHAPVGKADRVQAALPPPPTISNPRPEAIAQPDDLGQTGSQSDRSFPSADSSQHQAERRETKPVILSFEISSSGHVSSTSDPHASAHTSAQPSQISRSHPPVSEDLAPLTSEFFEGGSASLLARIIGAAEGTRTPDGHYTSAYYGHVDPGNQAWNLGSFSYQHGASSPAEADERQLRRLQEQSQRLLDDAESQHIRLTLEELLNGIDLANQAPLAALGAGGYIDRLKQAQNMGLRGSDAIVWARTRSFLDPHTQRWNAPGLGNTVDGISRDQERRHGAIAQTLMRLQPAVPSDVTPANVPEDLSNLPNTSDDPLDNAFSNRGTDASPSAAKSVIDQILSLDLPVDEENTPD